MPSYTKRDGELVISPLSQKGLKDRLKAYRNSLCTCDVELEVGRFPAKNKTKQNENVPTLKLRLKLRGVEIYRAISKYQADLVIFNGNIQGIVEKVKCKYTIIEKTVTKPALLLVLNF